MSSKLTIVSLTALLLMPGCAWKNYYRFQPTPSELAERESREKWAKDNHSSPSKAPSYEVSIAVTDKQILEYCNNVKNILRKRMTNSRLAAEGGAAMQVLTAAAAAAYGATAAGGAVSATTTEVMAGLSASSAAMPELTKVFGLGQRSDAFSQGVALIEAAEAQYYSSVVTEGGTAGQTKLSAAGAQLYSSTAAALKLVEHAIASQIPSIEDVQAARGIRINQIQVEPARLRIKLGDPNPYSVLVVDKGPVTAVTTSDKNIATVSALAAPANRFDVTAGAQPGVARVSFINDKGGSGSLTVDVYLPVTGNPMQTTVNVGASTTLTIDAASQATHVVVAPDGKVDVTPTAGVNLTTLTVTGKAKGTATITVRNDLGGEAQFLVTVP